MDSTAPRPGLALALLLATALPAAAAGLPICTDAETDAPAATHAETDTHRQFERPVVDYPPGTDPERIDTWLDLAVRVDASGRSTCAIERGGFAKPNASLQRLLAEAAAWRYQPFEREGKASPVIVRQKIDVQILPARTVAVPTVSADGTTVSVAHAGCFWECPEYAVSVRGDGWVGYQGIRHVDVPDKRAWRISPEEVAPLLALARSPELWAADPRHLLAVFDDETVVLRVDIGVRRQEILAYPPDHPGVPIAARRLMAAIDDISGVRQWTRLSNATLDVLRSEGFDFRSPAAGAILARSILHRHGHDEAAILRLIKLGAPTDNLPVGEGSLVSAALHRRLWRLVTPLIERRALESNGRPDQAKIDFAFQAAISAGQLAPVQQIWEIAGSQPHPALDFLDTRRGATPRHRSPVVLLLEQQTNDERWQGVEIALWLEAHGNGLAAVSEDGRSLFNVAADSEDRDFMAFLLDRSLDPSVLGQVELMKYSVRHGESMALALLQAQAHHRDGWHLPANYRQIAIDQGWTTVIEWLDAHPEVTLRPPPACTMSPTR